MKEPENLGEGRPEPTLFKSLGVKTIFEPGVRVFGPKWIKIGNGVYLGHDIFIRAYPQGELEIGDDCWIGPKCFINSYGKVTIGSQVGIGPGVYIVSSWHRGKEPDRAIMDTDLISKPVEIADGADIGAGAILLAGAVIGERAQVAAGALVRSRVEAGSVVAGVPSKPV